MASLKKGLSWRITSEQHWVIQAKIALSKPQSIHASCHSIISSHRSRKSKIDQQLTAMDATLAYEDEQAQILEEIKARQEEEEWRKFKRNQEIQCKEREDARRLQQLKREKERARLLALRDGSQTCSNSFYKFSGGKPKVSAEASVFQPSMPVVTPYAQLLTVSRPQTSHPLYVSFSQSLPVTFFQSKSTLYSSQFNLMPSLDTVGSSLPVLLTTVGSSVPLLATTVGSSASAVNYSGESPISVSACCCSTSI